MNLGNCVFSIKLYTVSRKQHCFRNMLSTSSSSRTKTCSLYSVASQLAEGSRLYAPSNAKKRDIAPERLLRCRPTFSLSLMVSVAISDMGCTELFFVEPGVKVNGRYYREVLLKKPMLPLMRCIAGDTYVFQQTAHRRTVLARQFSCCSRRHHSFFPPICVLLTART